MLQLRSIINAPFPIYVLRHPLQYHHRTTAQPIITRNQSNNTVKQQQCPFQTLGLTKNINSTYNEARTAFLSLAVKYHPDSSTDTNKKITLQKFIEMKTAFDQIQKYFSKDDNNNDENIEQWFYKETGKSFPSFGEVRLNSIMIQEIVNITKVTGCSGLDKGGMWEFARMISKKEADGEFSNCVESLEIEAPKGRRRRRR